MTVQNLSAQPPFITKDGSTIRSIETRSLPTSLAATHRGFALYVAFPKSSIPSIATRSMSLIPFAPFAGDTPATTAALVHTS